MSQSFRAVITLLDPIDGGHPDQGLPGDPNYPDQGLPEGEEPVDPGFGVGRPPHVGNLPPGMFPPHLPIVPRPPRPPHIWPPSGHVDNTLPLPPEDLLPAHPDQGLPPNVGQLPVFPGTPAEPGTIWPPLPGLPEASGNLLVIVWVPGVGYRWAVIDPSLTVDNDLPPERAPK
jgi:hypothetical protein